MTKRSRRIVNVAVVSLMLVVAGGVTGYQLYYRSDGYRRKVETSLTNFFGLPTDIGAVRPSGFTSRELINIQMWLPERRARIFDCPRAIWDGSDNNGGSDSNGSGSVLHLYDATLAVGSEEWESGDYMRVLKASLLHNFSDMNIRRVMFHNGKIAWPRRDLQIRAGGVNGSVVFDGSGHGEAMLTAQTLNERAMGGNVGDGGDGLIRIHAKIDPSNVEDFLPEVRLTVPSLPLETLNLDQVLGSHVTQGTFSGNITLRQSVGDDTIELAGKANDVRLDEFTQRLPSGPLAGRVDLTIHNAIIHAIHNNATVGTSHDATINGIHNATVRGHQLKSLQFNANVRELNVDPLLRQYGLPEIGGQITLDVTSGRVQGETIESMLISGHWQAGSLATLSRALMPSLRVQGQVTMTIHSLVIQNNNLASGHIDVIATPLPNKPSTIPRAVLIDLLARYAGFQMPEMLAKMLPESIEFAQAKAKLLIDHRELKIVPLEQAGDNALLTLRINGQEVPLVLGIEHTIDLGPMLDKTHERAHGWKQTIQERIIARRSATQPASRPSH